MIRVRGTGVASGADRRGGRSERTRGNGCKVCRGGGRGRGVRGVEAASERSRRRRRQGRRGQGRAVPGAELGEVGVGLGLGLGRVVCSRVTVAGHESRRVSVTERRSGASVQSQASKSEAKQGGQRRGSRGGVDRAGQAGGARTVAAGSGGTQEQVQELASETARARDQASCVGGGGGRGRERGSGCGCGHGPRADGGRCTQGPEGLAGQGSGRYCQTVGVRAPRSRCRGMVSGVEVEVSRSGDGTVVTMDAQRSGDMTPWLIVASM